MAMVLARVLCSPGGFTRQKAVAKYQEWANSGIPFLGKNTAKLFKGVKTFKGYQNRFEKNHNPQNQGNGPLMRAYPLILDPSAIKPDVFLTVENEMCEEMVSIYVNAIKNALDNMDKKEILDHAISLAKHEETILCLNQVLNNEVRNIGGKVKRLDSSRFLLCFL